MLWGVQGSAWSAQAKAALASLSSSKQASLGSPEVLHSHTSQASDQSVHTPASPLPAGSSSSHAVVACANRQCSVACLRIMREVGCCTRFPESGDPA